MKLWNPDKVNQEYSENGSLRNPNSNPRARWKSGKSKSWGLHEWLSPNWRCRMLFRQVTLWERRPCCRARRVLIYDDTWDCPKHSPCSRCSPPTAVDHYGKSRRSWLQRLWTPWRTRLFLDPLASHRADTADVCTTNPKLENLLKAGDVIVSSGYLLELPESPYRGIIRSRSNSVPAGMKLDSIDVTLMTVKGLNALPSSHIPY